MHGLNHRVWTAHLMGFFAVAASLPLLTGCGGSDGSAGPNGLAIKIFPAYSDTQSDYTLQEAYAGRPMVVDLAALGLEGRFASARISGQGETITLPRLGQDVSFSLVLSSAQGAQRTIQISAGPADFPAMSTSVTAAAADGNIYTSVFTGFDSANYSYHLILRRDGSPLYYRRLDHPTFDFHQVRYADGRLRYAYLDAPAGFNPDKGAAEGDIVLLDEGFREIRRGRLLPHGRHGPLPAENHDALILDDDDWVISAYDTRTVDLRALGGRVDTQVVATVVQEVRSGSVLWEFDSTDYPQFYAASTDGNDYTNTVHPLADYMHFNAIERDASDGSYLLSFRHLDSIVKIAPIPAGNGPMPLKWVLGGKLDQFGLAPALRFYHQHDARIVGRDGSRLRLSLFNNNNGHYDQHPSSAMVFDVDETARAGTLVDQYWDAQQSTSQGSVQVLGPRHYFICWGSVTEITEVIDGLTVFHLGLTSPGFTYRARKGD